MATQDDKLPGLMAFVMRYAEELKNPAEFFSDIKPVAIEEDQLALAKELIKRKAANFAPEKFKDEYENALRAMVEAKVKNLPIPPEAAAPASPKVVNLMDALRQSVQSDEPAGAPKKKPAGRETAAKAGSPKKGIALVKSTKARKSA
jgi:DNA end-binding protein Ku